MAGVGLAFVYARGALERGAARAGVGRADAARPARGRGPRPGGRRGPHDARPSRRRRGSSDARRIRADALARPIRDRAIPSAAMRDLTSRALDTATALGATYADVRVVRRIEESITIKSGRVEGVAGGESEGFGVRVLVDGAWGFAASHAPVDRRGRPGRGRGRPDRQGERDRHPARPSSSTTGRRPRAASRRRSRRTRSRSRSTARSPTCWPPTGRWTASTGIAWTETIYAAQRE